MSNLWSKISGFKTIAGGILHAAWFVYYVFVDKTIDTETKYTGHGIVFTLTGTGITHKIIKNKDSINEGINNAKKRILNK